MNNKYSLPKDGGLIAESTPRDIIHRYEKIHTTVYENEYLGVQSVADTIVKAIRTYNELHCSNEVYEEQQPFVLGLTTGRTPLGLYRELVKRHKEGLVSFRNVAVFSLDEFYPIRSTEQQSRNFRIHEDFLNHIDILPENIHIPDGTISEDKVSEYCASYDHSVRKIDLMIIGVGEDGQIGFNEPGSYAKSRTRLVQLTHNTRKIQSGAFFGLDYTPKLAITMGIDTIMRADKIILMAWGEEKAQIIQKVVEGEITTQVPASNLQAHPNIEVVIDENAAQLLAGADGKSILALLLLGIPAACAAGCLCMFGAAALQVSGRIRAYSFRKTAGQACSGARELMGQYLLVIVVFLPLCGAATGVAYLSGKIL